MEREYTLTAHSEPATEVGELEALGEDVPGRSEGVVPSSVARQLVQHDVTALQHFEADTCYFTS